MKIYQLNNTTFDLLVSKTAQFLKAGAIVVIPTETCYGMAVDYKNLDAVDRLFKIKQRPKDSKLAIAVKDLDQAKQIANIDNRQMKWLNGHLPNTFTVIFNARSNFELNYPDVGIRFSTNAFVSELTSKYGAFALSSANIHGLPETYSLMEIQNQYAGMIFQPDLLIDSGTLLPVSPSSLINFKERKPKIIRQGTFLLN